MSATVCGFPGCGRDVEAKGLCHAHYRQRQRKRPLTPLRIGDPGVKLPGVTVKQEHADVLTSMSPSLYAATKAAIEGFVESKLEQDRGSGREKGGGP